VPGSALRGDDLDTMVAAVRQQLRAYLACGVTTVLDTGINHEHARMIRGWLEGDQPGPHPEFLGVPVSPPGGYITTVFPEAPSHGTPEAVTAHLDSLVALDAAGVKVTMEQGFIGKGWPLQTPEMRETISREAAARDLPIYIHGMSPREYRYSLDMGVYAMVHPLEWPHRGTINRLREEGTYVISTIGIADMFMVANDPARLSDPTTRLVTPEYILDTAADPAMRDAAREQVLEMIAPDLPGFLEGVAYQQLDGLGPTRRRVRALQESVVQLQRAGVKVIVGSDAGNWTVMPWSFHGISTLREIELWGEAGIDPEDTLLAATRLPAEMLGLDDEIGTIEPGKRGDLVLYRGDPTRDLRDVRTVAYTVRAGVAKTPTQWMEQ
jgi:imidazolonepropionase-like amidohydrolase